MKKRSLSVLLSLCMLLAVFPSIGTTASAAEAPEFTYSAGASYTSGSAYEISSTDTLISLSRAVAAGNTMEGVTFQLTGDLDLNSGFTFDSTGTYSGDGDGTPYTWTPIGNDTTVFSGTFDGGNHTISGLYKNSSSDYTGLFGYVGEKGTVEGLSIVNSCFYASGGGYVGGVAGNNDGTIKNCSNAANIYGYQYVGGIAGYSIGTIANCSNSADIKGSYRNIGGIVGNCNGGGTISNSYNTGEITGGRTAGGIAGYCAKSTIYNNYNAGNVTGSSYVHSLVGSCVTSIVRYCYWLKTNTICTDLSAVGTLYCVGCGYVTSADGYINLVTYTDNTVVTGSKVTLVEALNTWVKEYENLSDYDTWTVTSGVNGGLPTLGSAWESTTVDVKYYDGDDPLKSQTVTVGRGSLSNYEPTADGSDFLGWATSPDSDTVTYLPLEAYTSADYENDSSPSELSLYAVWDTAAGAEHHYTATVYLDYDKDKEVTDEDDKYTNIDIDSTDEPSGKIDVGDTFEFGDTASEIAALPGASAQLTIYAQDVDAPYEIDTVYLVDVTDADNPITWTIGKLSGLNDDWNTTVLSVPQSLFKSGRTYQLQISASEGWAVHIRSVYLLLDGGNDAANILDKSVSVSVDTDGHPSAITSLTTVSASTYTLEYKLSSVDENGDTVQLGGNGDDTHEIETTSSDLTGIDPITWSDLTLESGTTYQLDVTINNGDNIPVSTITKTFTVYDYSYDLNGHGDSAPDGGIVMAGEKLTEPSPSPEADGYDFCGWYEECSCTNQWHFDIDKINDDTTLYAKWTGKTYTVTLNVNGGMVDSGNVTSYTHGTGCTLPTGDDIKKSGDTFGGWYENEDLTGDAVTAIDGTDMGEKTYYAKWVENPVMTGPSNATAPTGSEVTFTVNAAVDSGTLSYQWQKKSSGGDWTDIDSARSEAYTIDSITASDAGEYRCAVTNTDGTTAVTNSDAATLTVTFTATVNIQLDGAVSGTPAGTGVKLKQSETEVTPTGSEGVYTADVANGTYDVYVNGEDTGVDITVHDAANSVAVDYYTVNFSAVNTGAASGSKVTATVGGTEIDNGAPVLKGRTIVLTAEGVIFDKDNATGPSYAYRWSGDSVTGTPTTQSITIRSLSGTVDAECTVTGSATYKVTLNLNGGTVNSGNVISYDYGTGAILPDDVTRDGAVFGGWYTASDFSGSAVPTISSTDMGAKTYYAKWVLSPNVSMNPENATAAAGSAVTFSVTASAESGTLSYQWQKKGSDGNWIDIDTATDATYSISSVSAGDAGEYRCVISNTDGTAAAVSTSGTAALTVTFTATVTINNDNSASSVPVTGNVELKQEGDAKATLTGSWGVYTANVGNGTYDVYVNNEDTGVDLAIRDAAAGTNVYYYTVSFSATDVGMAGGSTVTATSDGMEIASGAAVRAGKKIVLTATGKGASYYSYFWAGTGTNGQDTDNLTISALNGTVNAACTVTGRSTAATYSVSLNTNGGSISSGSITSYTFGVGATLPTAVTRTDSVFIGWYATSDFSGSPVTAIGPAEIGNKTFYAKWNYDISGTVTDGNEPIAGVTVTIRGNNIMQQTTYTGPDGDYSFSDIPPGEYNIVAISESETSATKTIILYVSDASITDANIQMPSAGAENSVVTIAENTPDVVVGYLDQQFSSYDDTYVGSDSSNTVKIELTVEKQSEDVAAGAENIKSMAGTRTVDMYLDMALIKTVTGTESAPPETLAEIPTDQLLKIIIPYELSGKTNVKVYRVHSGTAESLTEKAYSTEVQSTECFMVDHTDDVVIIWANKFSTYAIAYSDIVYDNENHDSERYTIDVSASTGGTISTDKNSNVANGGSITYTITPGEGYCISDVLVDGKSVGAVSSYTFTNVKQTHTIQAVFAKITGLPYYLDEDASRVFIGFASDKSGTMKYLAPEGTAVQFTPNPKDFTDIAGHWSKNYIDFVTEREIFVGTGTDIFSPDVGMTRAMFATVIGRLYERSYGPPESTGQYTFADCNYDKWYGDYIGWCADNGIIKGVGGGLYEPDREITREEMAAILYRFAKLMGGTPADFENVQLGYPDASGISSWAADAAKYCQLTGIIQGREGGYFVPQGTATRAEVAVILERFIETVV